MERVCNGMTHNAILKMVANSENKGLCNYFCTKDLGRGWGSGGGGGVLKAVRMKI